VDAAGIIGNFECMNRIADACGIACDAMMAKMVGDAADLMKIRHFPSAQNTPAGRV